MNKSNNNDNNNHNNNNGQANHIWKIQENLHYVSNLENTIPIRTTKRTTNSAYDDGQNYEKLNLTEIYWFLLRER